MIEAMRSKAASWVVKILALFLIVSFGIWGIGDMIRGVQTNTEAASVGGTDISRAELSSQFSRLVHTMQERIGPTFNVEQAVRLGLLDQTLEQMVDSRLLSLEAERLGLAAGTNLVRETIYQNPEFRGPGGGFDRRAYEEGLSRRGMSESTYVATLRDDIVRNEIAGALTVGATPPAPLTDVVYSYRNEQRVAEVAVVPAGKPADVPAPTDAELADFHKKNAGMFTAPEYRAISVLYLDPDEAAKHIRVPENRLRDEYAQRKDSLSVPERRTIRQALLPDEAKADKLVKAVAAGQSFAAVTKQITGAEPISLGTLARTDLPAEIADAAFALAKDGVSKPVKTALGWHVLNVTAIEPGKTPKFEAVRDKIAKDLAREQAVDELIKKTNKIDDTLAGGGSLADAGAVVDAQPRTIPAIAADGSGPDGKPVTGLPPGAEFLRTVFGLAAGETSGIVDTDNGGFFVVHLDSITPPTLRPLASVRDKVIAAWKHRKLEDAAEEKAAHLQERARATSFDAAAKAGGYEVATSKPFSRFIRPEGSIVSDDLSTALFKAKPGAIVSAPTAGGVAVARLVKVIDAKPGANEAERNSLKDELHKAMGTDMLAQLLAALRLRYPVKINRAAVNIVAGTGSGS